MIDRQLGAYRILRELGRGGMGVVYAAEHTRIGRKAAVKVIHNALTAREEVVQRFFNEARAAATIDDPGTVQVFDFGNDDGSAYLVMELLTGETLATRLANGARLPPGDALRVARQVANTLGKAHAKNIVHRDLKPENIFMVHDDEVPGGERPKILDFGIAKLLQDPGATIDTGTGEVLGTPMYMSPEQCRGAGHVDHRADIYSLGCVLFRMLTGRPPFVAEGMGDLIALHLREPPMPPSAVVPGLSAAVDALVMRCLAKDPATRYQTMTELIEAIGRIDEPGLPRVDTERKPKAIAADPPTPSMARGETLPATDSVVGVTPVVRARPAPWRIVAAIALVLGVGVAIVRPWKRSATPEAAPAPAIVIDATSAAELGDTAGPDATPGDAAPADAAAPIDASLPTDAARARRLPRDAAPAALPIDARARTIVDLDNDGIPDRR